MDNIYTISRVAEISGGQLVGDQLDPEVRHIATDSRTLPGIEGVMFAAINGVRHNANDYIDELYERGVRVFLTDQKPQKQYNGAVFCLVEDVISALQLLGKAKRDAYSGKLIAITGSNGKTIVKEWLYQMLQQFATVVRSPRSYNSQLGVPLSLWLLDDTFEYAIIEAGISMPGEMEILEGIIRPDIGILTNIGEAHAENFNSLEEKLKEKLTLFKRAGLIICNDGLVESDKTIEKTVTGARIRKADWTFDGNAMYIFRKNIPPGDESGILLSMAKTGESFHLPYSDRASVENLTNVTTTMLELGFPAKKISRAIRHIEPVKMRLETLKGIMNSTIISDGYNSDLTGLKVALDVLNQQNQHQKKVVIISDILQSGLDDNRLYSEASEVLRFYGIDKVYCIGEHISSQSKSFPESAEFYADVSQFLEQFSREEITDAAVLVKGARKFRFEEVVRSIQLQFQQTTLEINLNNLVANLNYYRSLVKEETKIMVMVKALAYGSGTHEIAGYLQHHKVDYLAVAFPDEGVRLRRNGVRIPIMVMNAASYDYRLMLEHDLEPEIFNRDGLLEFIRECRYLGFIDQAVHIKLDTGMHRLGFGEDDLSWLCEVLKSPELKVTSIFSHLAGSDDIALDSFTRLQADRLKRLSEKIMHAIGSQSMIHILNSAGIERFPEFQFDMVRLGIGLYGVGKNESLVPVNVFRTVISQVHELEAGETVSYNRSGELLRYSRIATIPVGYADGIDRRLGNGNYNFIVRGKLIPTIGDICMDMTMIDITDTDATEGDEVELFGSSLPVQQMADRLGTIVYEILTSIPERVKRVYIRE